jgi:hypothetical protein
MSEVKANSVPTTFMEVIGNNFSAANTRNATTLDSATMRSPARATVLHRPVRALPRGRGGDRLCRESPHLVLAPREGGAISQSAAAAALASPETG